MAAQYWIRVRFVTDALVTSDKPLTPADIAKAALNAGTAIRTTAFEGVKDVTVSFLEEHRLSQSHIHDATEARCAYCFNHARDELGTEYTN